MKKKKELTEEEHILQEKNSGISNMKNHIKYYVNQPTYYFSIGDKVILGNLKDCTIDEIYYDGKFYGVKCIATDNNYGKPIEHNCYRVVPWVSIRPIKRNSNAPVFSIDDDLRLNPYTATIESLIHSYYSFGIDMSPEYQRDYVWDENDRISLIESIFNNIDIGRFLLNHLEGDKYYQKEMSYEIVDGKQRLNTLIMFYENRLKFNGYYFNDLNGLDKHTFLNHNISIAQINNADEKTILKYFLKLNTSGKTMGIKDIEKIKILLNSRE